MPRSSRDGWPTPPRTRVARCSRTQCSPLDRRPHSLRSRRPTESSRSSTDKNNNLRTANHGFIFKKPGFYADFIRLKRWIVRFHPDKNGGSVESQVRFIQKINYSHSSTETLLLSQTAFADIVDAYEILGDPEVRMMFDEHCGLDPQDDSFDTFAQYVNSGSKKAPDFYTGERTITLLNEKYWERRLSGESIWLVEFYAPWCSACQRFSKDFKATAALLEEDEIEVGAINCQTEASLCAELFAIRSYQLRGNLNTQQKPQCTT